MSYLPPFQNCLSLDCSLSQAELQSVTDQPTNQLPNHLTQGKDRDTQALLS